MRIERLYSDYDEYYEEKLYSTGNDELDELLEKAFCDGYEYAQREFTGAVKRANKAKKKQWEEAIGKGITEQEIDAFRVADANKLAKQDIQFEKAGGTNHILGGQKRQPGERASTTELFARIPTEKKDTWQDIPVEEDAINRRKYRNAREKRNIDDTYKVDNVNKSINKRGNAPFSQVKEYDRRKYSWESNEEHAKKLDEARKSATDTAIENNKHFIENNPDYIKSLKENAAKRARKRAIKKGLKIAAIAIPTTAAAVGTGVAIKKHHDKKKKEQE